MKELRNSSDTLQIIIKIHTLCYEISGLPPSQFANHQPVTETVCIKPHLAHHNDNVHYSYCTWKYRTLNLRRCYKRPQINSNLHHRFQFLLEGDFFSVQSLSCSSCCLTLSFSERVFMMVDLYCLTVSYLVTCSF